MKACHFLMLTDWFEEMIRNWLQLVCTSFRIKWVKVESVPGVLYLRWVVLFLKADSSKEEFLHQSEQ